MTVRQIMQLLRGEPGTIVRLEVLPAAAKESRTLEIQRDTTAAWLWAVIQAADPDPWRRRVRDACELEDDTLRRAELEKLADAADLARSTRAVSGPAGCRTCEGQSDRPRDDLLEESMARVSRRCIHQHQPGHMSAATPTAED